MCDSFPFHEPNRKKVVKKRKKSSRKCVYLFSFLFVPFLLLLRVNRKPSNLKKSEGKNTHTQREREREREREIERQKRHERNKNTNFCSLGDSKYISSS